MVELEILNRKGEQMIKINVVATTIKQVTELFKTHYKKKVIKIISGNPKTPTSIFQAKLYRVKTMGVPVFNAQSPQT
jgi:ribosomal protein L11 methylase PrmA